MKGEELLVTVDTNLLDPDRLATLSAAVNQLPIDIAIVTVSQRESRRAFAEFHTLAEKAVSDESVSGSAVWSGPIHETFVMDESRLGEAVLGSEASANLMQGILEVIGNGSFPKRGKRGQLTDGQRRQLRDAVILEAHTRNRRHVFVTEDRRGFIRAGRRAKLEQLCSTQILTMSEFLTSLESARRAFEQGEKHT